MAQIKLDKFEDGPITRGIKLSHAYLAMFFHTVVLGDFRSENANRTLCLPTSLRTAPKDLDDQDAIVKRVALDSMRRNFTAKVMAIFRPIRLAGILGIIAYVLFTHYHH